MPPKIVIMLPQPSPKLFLFESLALKLIFFCHFDTVKGQKTAPKKQKLKSGKISLNDAKYSIQWQIPIFLWNFGSVKVVSVISFHSKMARSVGGVCLIKFALSVYLVTSNVG